MGARRDRILRCPTRITGIGTWRRFSDAFGPHRLYMDGRVMLEVAAGASRRHLSTFALQLCKTSRPVAIPAKFVVDDGKG